MQLSVPSLWPCANQYFVPLYSERELGLPTDRVLDGGLCVGSSLHLTQYPQ